MTNPANWHFDCSKCFYCGMYLARRHEHDHFPVPRTRGGKRQVPACLNCHDLKDRVGLANWPTDGAFEAIDELLRTIVPAPVLSMHASVPVPHGYPEWMSPYLAWSKVEPVWDSLSPIARVLYGKFLSIELWHAEKSVGNMEALGRELGGQLWRGTQQTASGDAV